MPQNQHLAYRPQAPLSLVPPPDTQPLTSATYIPGNDTFGVGIPPLFESHARTPYDAYRPGGNSTYETSISDGTYNPQTPGGRTAPPFALHNDVHELVSNENPPQSAAQGIDLNKSPSHRHNTSGASLGGLSPSEAAVQWPLDRVLLWLSKNGFSKDWQETFKSLELQGADFLELGLASGGRGNLGKIHKVVYPQLAKECARSGTGWDSIREREEGLRMRKLIRQLHDGGADSSISTPMRGEPPAQVPMSAESGHGYNSPYLHEPRSAGPTGGVNDITAEQLAALQNSSTGQAQKPSSQMRSVTMPVPSGYDSPIQNSPSRESPSWLRSDYTRGALATISDHRRQSPSTSSDTGPFANGTIRPHDSPKSGSPATQHVSPSYAGLTSASTGDLTLRYEHSRGNSTDSTHGAGRGASSTTGRYYDHRRQAQDGPRPSTQDAHGRPLSGDNAAAYSKDHSKGILSNIFSRRKGAKTHESHPSPDEQHLDSPPSPESRTHSAPSFPYSKPGFNSSDMSLGERPASATTMKTKRWIFGTLDGVNYRLIDVTDMDSVEALRAGICQKLGISDWTSAQIFLTEPGQTDHEEALSDTNLALSRRNKSDAYGSLKLFVKGTTALHTLPHPQFEGLGVSILGDKSAPSPTAAHAPIHRKPLDQDALDRISPLQAKPTSPLLGSRQTTLKASGPTGSNDSSQPLNPEKADLLARHEAYLRDVERKQKEHRISRVSPSTNQAPKDSYGDTGFRRGAVIDFDERRLSPYDEKKSETLMPHRKPPVAPNGSNTLTKVNSLRKSAGERSGRSPAPAAVQTHGLGAVLASMGRMTSAIGTPSPSVPASSAPSSANRESFGLDSDRPSTLGSAETSSSKSTLGKSRSYGTPLACAVDSMNSNADHIAAADSSKTPQSSTRETSPQSSRPSLQSRKSFGPEFDFEEHEVSFQRTPQPEEATDDESDDDNLFAVPLASKRAQKPEAESQAQPESERKKPNLTVNTDSKKPRAVSFVSPNTTSGESFTGPADAFDSKDRSSGHVSGPVSPEDERPPRRDSFANGDIWASRPPVEGVINNLDDFFPNVDLDAPYLDEPPSPNSRDNVENDASAKDSQAGGSTVAADPPNAYGTDASTVRPQPGMVARRNVGRSGGGLSRAKSIREVARGAAHRTKSISSSGPQKSGELLRRKSTKMFGAKIMQISPKPGTRLSQLDPIPQNSAPSTSSGPVPQRQATFRIIRGQLIGKGTYGRVYLGINADNGEVLAVKQVEINPRIAGTDRDRVKEMVAALDQEIDTMQHLEHPNIVQYLGCERGDLSISIYLEYISGGSVGSCLRKHGKFEESVVKSLTQQTLSGLAYLHDKGILHRDLKADNILLDLDGTCKISDFGISKKTDDIYGNDSSNSMQGSVFWMAPEVIQSKGQGYSAKVDIWSLGCVVLEMFAGRRPWSKEEAIGAIFKLGSLSQAPPIPDDVSMNISPIALAFMYDCFTV